MLRGVGLAFKTSFFFGSRSCYISDIKGIQNRTTYKQKLLLWALSVGQKLNLSERGGVAYQTDGMDKHHWWILG